MLVSQLDEPIYSVWMFRKFYTLNSKVERRSVSLDYSHNAKERISR